MRILQSDNAAKPKWPFADRFDDCAEKAGYPPFYNA
jgi:hypothetical protein